LGLRESWLLSRARGFGVLGWSIGLGMMTWSIGYLPSVELESLEVEVLGVRHGECGEWEAMSGVELLSTRYSNGVCEWCI
jgi:hypothetical protein